MNWIRNIILKYVLGRLNEQSTWQGIVLAIASWLASHGYVITDEQSASMLGLFLAIVAAINAFLPDKFLKSNK